MTLTSLARIWLSALALLLSNKARAEDKKAVLVIYSHSVDREAAIELTRKMREQMSEVSENKRDVIALHLIHGEILDYRNPVMKSVRIDEILYVQYGMTTGTPEGSLDLRAYAVSSPLRLSGTSVS